MIPEHQESQIANQPSSMLDELEDCAICFEELVENKFALICKHIFHKACIERWLTQTHTCPLCREHIEVVEPAYMGGIPYAYYMGGIPYASYSALEDMATRTWYAVINDPAVQAQLQNDLENDLATASRPSRPFIRI
jgi:hypothetical protein